MNGNDRFPQLFWGMAVLAVGLMVVGVLTGAAIREAKRGNDTITVTGSARQTVKSDYATWAVTVWCLNHDAPPYDCVRKRGERIREFLKAHHVADSSITQDAIRVDQIFDQSRGRMKGEAPGSEFIGFKCSQRFEVRTMLVDSVNALVRDAAALIPELVEMSSEAPQFYYTKLNDLRVQMLAEATKDARVRAEEIAKSAGGKIRSLRSARQGVFQITAPLSREVRDYGIYDTSTIDKDITSVVSVTFSVE